MSAGDQAWVTLATNDSYALGALVVARSLKRVNTTRKLAVMITPGVTGPMRDALTSEFDVVSPVNVLDSEDSANLALLTRPELGITFTKLHCWRLTQFSKCVFLDADTLILQNCDELFDREEFSAAPDVGWPDCFNSGVFVFKPSIDKYNELLAFAVSSGSFDGGDQGLLNLYFNDWSVSDIGRHLPFIYNMVASATYSYLPAFKVFGANVKIVHFIGSEKPWLMYFDSATSTVKAPSGQEHLQELLQSWWDIFRADVHRKLSPDMAGLAGAFAKMSLEGAKSSEQIEFEETMRKHAWESGHIDYMGKDSFDNIMKKIQSSMAQTSTTEEEKPKEKSPSPPKTVVEPPQVAPQVTPAPSTEVPQPKVEPTPVVAPPSTTPAVESKPGPTTVTKPAPTPVAEKAPIPVAEKAPSAAQVVVEKTPEELEEIRLLEERQALEKKLAEQKRIAEQKLQEEKQAALSRAAAAGAQKSPSTEKVAPAPAPETATASSETETEAPVAPPRKQSKGESSSWRNVGFSVGLGLSVVVVAYAIYSASASVTSPVGDGHNNNY